MQLGGSQHCCRSFIALAALCFAGERCSDHRLLFSFGSNAASIVPLDMVAATFVLNSVSLGRYYHGLQMAVGELLPFLMVLQ